MRPRPSPQDCSWGVSQSSASTNEQAPVLYEELALRPSRTHNEAFNPTQTGSSGDRVRKSPCYGPKFGGETGAGSRHLGFMYHELGWWMVVTRTADEYMLFPIPRTNSHNL